MKMNSGWENPHIKTPPFPYPPHPQSGPVQGSVVLFFRNGARRGPGSVSSNPLVDTNLLEDFTKQGIRMLVHDEGCHPSVVGWGRPPDSSDEKTGLSVGVATLNTGLLFISAC